MNPAALHDSVAGMDDPVMTRFRAALDAIYGERLARVVLFGSRARGEARADSDYDVAVFLRGAARTEDERHRVADVTTDLLLETGAFIVPLTFDIAELDRRTMFMGEVRREGVEV